MLREREQILRGWDGDGNSGVASYGALGHVPPRLPTISFVVHFGVNPRLTDSNNTIVQQLTQVCAILLLLDRVCGTTYLSIYRVAQNKIPHQTICNISATDGLILKILEAA